MLYIVILVCAVAMPPEACDEHTASQVIVRQGDTMTTKCVLAAYTEASQIKIAEGFYFKISCARGQPV